MNASKIQMLLSPPFFLSPRPLSAPLPFSFGLHPSDFFPSWTMKSDSIGADRPFLFFFLFRLYRLPLPSPLWLLYDLLLLSPFSPVYVCVLPYYTQRSRLCRTCVGKENEETPPRFISGIGRKAVFFLDLYMALILLDENVIAPAIENNICPNCVQEVFILV